MSACILVAEYRKHLERKLALYDGFSSLISFIRSELACRCRSVSEFAEDINIPSLEDSGFSDELRRTGSLDMAFSRMKERVPILGGEVTRLLEGYFESFGKSYREEEEEDAARVFEELTRLYARERADSQRSLRTTRVLVYAVTLGAIILML